MAAEVDVLLAPVVALIEGVDDMLRTLTGDTVKFTWVDSGVSVDSGHLALYTGSETVVGTYAAVDSGGGHYYADVPVPDVAGFYVGEFVMVAGGNTYRRRRKFWAVTGEVD